MKCPKCGSATHETVTRSFVKGLPLKGVYQECKCGFKKRVPNHGYPKWVCGHEEKVTT